MSDLGVSADIDGVCCTIEIAGEARLETVVQFERVVREVMAAGATRLIVDFTGLEFMDSASAGMLLRLRNQVAEIDGILVLCCMRRLVARLFERTGLQEQFQCVATKEDALALLV